MKYLIKSNPEFAGRRWPDSCNLHNPLESFRNLPLVFLGILLFAVSCVSTVPEITEPEPVVSLPIPEPPIKEMRAVWLSRFEFCEYSSTHDQDSIRTYIVSTIKKAAEANFNLVFFQVRGNGDAYYKPGLEPWGHLLTGVAGKDPGWDPLQVALDTAHFYGLELHAWVNTFPIWRGETPPPDTVKPMPPYLLHKNWLVSNSAGIPMPLSSHYVSLSPGNPDVHQYLINLVTDIITRYPVDGVHFDYIRYPEGSVANGFSHDSVSVARFNSPEGNPFKLDWRDWQREQLTEFVARMYNAIQVVNPDLKMSAAVIGNYRENAWNAYNEVFQDPRRWSELGKIDFIAPMIYWPRSAGKNGFLILAQDYRSIGTVDRFLIPGIGSYRYNTTEPPYTWDETIGEIDDLRRHRFAGMAFFGSRSLQDHWEELSKTRFRFPANIPALTWKDSIAPKAPSILIAVREEQTIRIEWTPSVSPDTKRYNIYFSSTLPIDSTQAGNLLMVTSSQDTFWDVPVRDKVGGYVAVSALDSAWNESPLSKPVFIGIP